MSNEVKIKLTDAQKAKIKEATGKDLPEIRVEILRRRSGRCRHVPGLHAGHAGRAS